jgi:hypothetical protein
LLSWQSKTLPQVLGEAIFTLKTLQQKKSQISLKLDFERKTRLELAFKHIENQTITITNKVALQM